jgi:hypothetical protein
MIPQRARVLLLNDLTVVFRFAGYTGQTLELRSRDSRGRLSPHGHLRGSSDLLVLGAAAAVSGSRGQLLLGQRPGERVGGVVGVRLENFLVIRLGLGCVARLHIGLAEQGQNQRVALVGLLQFSDCGLVVCRVKRDIAVRRPALPPAAAKPRPISRQLANPIPQGICRYNPGSGFAPIAIAGSNPSHSLH